MAPDRDKAKAQRGEVGTMARRRILVVEDEIAVAEHVRSALASRGYDALDAIASGEEAVDRVEEMRPDLVLMDIRLMGEMDGVEAAEQIRARFDVPVVYLTALADEMTLQRARVSQPFGYILKPFRVDDLHSTIEMALYKHEMDRKLRESEETARILLNAFTDIVALIDIEGFILVANEAMARRFGRRVDELVGACGWDLVQPDVAERRKAYADQVVQSGEPVRFEDDRQGMWFDNVFYPVFDARGRVTKIAVLARDITERKQMEAQIQEHAEHLERLVAEKMREVEEEHAKAIHSSRLAALGQMATGVAHELNQPLTAMQFEADYLRTVAQRIEEQADTPPPDVDGRRSELAEELRQMGKGLTGDIARCRRLIDHLRAFGRASPGHPTSVDLNKPIEGCFILVGERLRERGIVVEGQLAPDLPPVLAEANRLEQVFLNLIGNAEDALQKMERRVEAGEVECPGYQKRLEVSTYVSSTPPAGGAEGGRWVVAEVRDNGCGIAEADRERVFEPFFTTKPVGEGTGLGLSIGYGIVTEYGGEITFESAENEGTVFTVRFPAAGGT